ncbi:MAG: hypothetical protein Q9P14_01415 [candidate division KSB1 bacterium]|nr:hypothetical protein [candidate division KSB1 bacterium]
MIFIIITAYGTIDNALEACRQGADDYVAKPFGREQLLFTLEKALRTRQLETENIQLRSELLKNYDFSAIIARSQPMQEVLKMVARVVETEATVLILGEERHRQRADRARHSLQQRPQKWPTGGGELPINPR